MPAGQLELCAEAHAVSTPLVALAPAAVATAEKVKGAHALHTTSVVFVPAAEKNVPAGHEELHGAHAVALLVPLKVPAVHAVQPTTPLQRPVVKLYAPLAAPFALAEPATQRQSAGPWPASPLAEKEFGGQGAQLPEPSAKVPGVAHDAGCAAAAAASSSAAAARSKGAFGRISIIAESFGVEDKA